MESKVIHIPKDSIFTLILVEGNWMLYELDDIYLWGNNDNHRMLRSKEEFGRLQDSLTDKQLNVSRAYGCLRKMIETGLVKKVTKEEKLREVF